MKGKTGKECCETACKTGCGCRCHKSMKGMALLIVGLIFLAKARGWLAPMTADTIWPLVLVVVGVMALLKGMCKCCGTCK